MEMLFDFVSICQPVWGGAEVQCIAVYKVHLHLYTACELCVERIEPLCSGTYKWRGRVSADGIICKLDIKIKFTVEMCIQIFFEHAEYIPVDTMLQQLMPVQHW